MRTVRVGGPALLLLIASLSLFVAAAHVASRHSRFAAPRPASCVPGAPWVAPRSSLPSSGVRATSERPPARAPAGVGVADPRPALGEGSSLLFEPSEVDLGRLAAGEARRVEVPWRRVGAGALRVRQVVTGCGCVVAQGLEGALPEAASGVLLLDLAGRARAGPFAETVRVLTDRPPDDVITVRVRGFVGGDTLVSPPSLVVGPVHPGESLVRWLTVRAPPGLPATGRGAPDVDAQFVGLAGTVRGLPPARPGAVGWDLEVTLTTPTARGPFAASLELRVGSERLVRVPIAGVVEGGP